MRSTTIITAKIRPNYYSLIVSGFKRFEVRSESFGQADAIRYIDSVDGTFLGIRRILGVTHLNRSQDDDAKRYAAIGEDDFYRLFPRPEDGGPYELWAAKIGDDVTLDQLFSEEEEGIHE